MTNRTENDAVPASPPRATLKQWLGLIIMVVPLFMLATDVTVLYLAMPAISADLLPAGSQQLWILHIGEFLSAATMITFGLLARRIGARRLLLGAVAAYAVASLLAAYAVNPEMLIGGRALLGMAAAAFTPAGMILIRRSFRDPKQYNIAFAAFIAAFTGGAAAGPPFGGLILEHFWWGAVFLINVPIAAVLLIGGPLLLERNYADRSVKLDAASVVLSVAAILALVYGFQELSAGESTWLPLLSSSVGIGLLMLFIRRQRTAEHPLLDLELFGSRTMRLMLVVLFVGIFSLTVAEMLLPQYMQLVRGLSPLETGMVLLTPALGGTAGTMLTPLLAQAKHKGHATAAMLALSALLTAGLILLLPEANLTSLVIALTLIALTSSPYLTLVSQMLIGAAPEEKTGSASALQEVTASLGMASSLAFLGAGALAFYRYILTAQASGVPEDAVETAGESLGGSAAVAEGLGGSAGQRLAEAGEIAFTAVTQAGYGVGVVVFLGLAVVFLVLRRHVQLH